MSEPDPAEDAGGIGLALGGGGARGFAHVGVLQVLEENGLRVAAIAGTSMGGLLGALYAAGVPLTEIERESLRLTKPKELLKLFDLGATSAGLSVQGRRVYELLLKLFGGDREMETLPIPLALTATDLDSGREIVLRHGSLASAVRATISIPGIFQPVAREGMRLVDGGVLDNVPSAVAAGLSRRPVVAVDVLPSFADNQPGEPPRVAPLHPSGLRFLQDMVAAAQLMLAELTELRRAASPPALTLRPAIGAEVTILTGFDRAAQSIVAGRRAAEEALDSLRALAAREAGQRTRPDRPGTTHDGRA